MVALYDSLYIVVGLSVAVFGIMKINDMHGIHSTWYRYAYIFTTLGGGCMPFKFWYPQEFADWPALLVIVGAAMMISRDRRRPPKEIHNATAPR